MSLGLLRRAAEVDVNAAYFTGSEVACHCCGEVLIDLHALQCLDALRAALDRPLHVVSGYRCPEHNASVGGAPRSYHMRGMAFDVRCERGRMGEFVAVAREAGFVGIIMYPKQSFVHVDTRETPFFQIR